MAVCRQESRTACAAGRRYPNFWIGHHIFDINAIPPTCWGCMSSPKTSTNIGLKTVNISTGFGVIQNYFYTAADAAWSYETPFPAVAAIAGCLAFYPGRVDAIEQRQG